MNTLLQVIRENDTLLLFFGGDINKSLEFMTDKYNSGDFEVHLGYEEPTIGDYTFLGNKHPCIILWYDNEEDMLNLAEGKFIGLTLTGYEFN